MTDLQPDGIRRRRLAPELVDIEGTLTHVFGLIDADTGSPSLAELGVALIPTRDTSGMALGGEVGVVERAVSGADFGRPADAIDAPDGLKLRRGTLDAVTPVYSNPSPAAPFDSLGHTPLAVALASGLVPTRAGTAYDDTPTREYTVAGYNAGTHVVTVDDATGISPGHLCAWDIAGVRTLDLVVGVSSNTFTVLLGPHVADPTDELVRFGVQFDVTGHGTLGPSVVDVIDLVGSRQIGFGGRLSSVTFNYVGSNAEENAQVDASYTIRYAGIVQVAAVAADLVAQRLTPSGRKIAETARARVRISDGYVQADDAATSPPVIATPLDLEVEAMTIQIDLGMEPHGKAAHALGVRDLHPSREPSATAELTVRVARSELTDRIFDHRFNYHAFLIPLAPLGAHGCGFAFPAGVLTDDPRLIDSSKGYARYKLAIRMSAAHICDGDVAGCKVVLF